MYSGKSEERDVGRYFKESACLSRRSLFVTPTLRWVERGPTGGPEALCLLDSNAAIQGFWYGYVCRHPERLTFVSIIVFTTAFVDAFEDATLFARFDYWIRKRLKYDPCSSDGFSEIYRENADFAAAVSALEEMALARQRNSPPGDPDLRIVDVFGMTSFKNQDGVHPICP
ncbi:hypothetical protein G6M86_20175 [Agrobacterium tumefaciens]|uniref:Uncharacterized protein n=1 Tax=Agrobacterium tumefaciens TaxID=358 RepID=A0AAJ4TC15_AGRTU|nr:hypothetical protein [Agrobacterium tumefaciens]MBP2540275.1 hypothetical protein [Agrobacterium tumefaciens]QTG15567.1 hypothetical protein G6M86_20175 [Agrobacterium tumefaciens]